MPKLTYWVCPLRPTNNMDDDQHYNIRAKTRKEAVRMVKASGRSEDYAPPIKNTIHYNGVFGLVKECFGPNGVEPTAWDADYEND